MVQKSSGQKPLRVNEVIGNSKKLDFKTRCFKTKNKKQMVLFTQHKPPKKKLKLNQHVNLKNKNTLPNANPKIILSSVVLLQAAVAVTPGSSWPFRAAQHGGGKPRRCLKRRRSKKSRAKQKHLLLIVFCFLFGLWSLFCSASWIVMFGLFFLDLFDSFF